jgi:phosphoribosylglycinamide formyltransferase-1
MSHSRLAVLISGSGSNLQSIIDHSREEDFPGEIAVVISNRRDAFGLERARKAGIPAIWVPHRGKSRKEFEADLLSVLGEHRVDWIALAGFMRVLTPHFLSSYPGRVLNIHPSLLPSFPGMNAQKQAFEYGVKITGATVHFVDSGMDTGPIVMQKSVEVFQEDDEDSLKNRILSVEHGLYPLVLRYALGGKLHLKEGRVYLDKD